jgi:hypothetical protein
MALAATLQALFTTTAAELGRATGFIRRQRRLTAPEFARTLVFSWMADPRASLESMAVDLHVSAQALQQRLGDEAAAFFQALLAAALTQVQQAQPERLGLLDRFRAVLVEDTTIIALPAELAEEFPGCGGSDPERGVAALKVRLCWDVKSGQLVALTVHAGRTSDLHLVAAPAEVPAGALHLADQGFFDSERWQQLPPQRFWISRVPAGVSVAIGGLWQGLTDWLAACTEPVLDEAVQLVQKTGLPCRLVALRCPTDVATRRRQKLRAYTRRKKGREPSARQLLLCDWLVLATNVPATQLTPRELWIVYRCRWQVELLIKRGKQQLGWTFSRGHRGARVLVELYAKLVGFVVVHWASLCRGGPLSGCSPTKRFAAVQRVAWALGDSLTQGVAAVQTVLQHLTQRIARIRCQAESRKKPSTRQLLFKPLLAA